MDGATAFVDLYTVYNSTCYNLHMCSCQRQEIGCALLPKKSFGMLKYFKRAVWQRANTVVRQALSLREVSGSFPSCSVSNHLSSGKSWPNQFYGAESFVAVVMNAFYCKCYKANKKKKRQRNLGKLIFHIHFK